MFFRVLGPLRVGRYGGEEIITAPRRRVLLVRLLMSPNEVVPTGRLVEDVWEGAPAPGASSTLPAHVSVLRKVLGGDRLQFRNGGYVLAVNRGELDAELFEQEVAGAQQARAAGEARAAAELFGRSLHRWHGAALADARGALWATGEAARLDEMRAGATEGWLGARLELGDHHGVVAEATRAVAEFPLREGFWAALMLGLYRSGRQSEALRAFGRLRTVLGEELGIEPSPVLRELEEAVLLQKPTLDWHPPEATLPPVRAAAAPEHDQRGRAYLSTGPPPRRPVEEVAHNLPAPLSSFLGRQEELALGARLLASTRMLSVTGPGGTGKTRLAYQLAAQQLDQFPDGVWVAELGPSADAALVPATLMAALGLRDEPVQSATATLVSYLRGRCALVVLDNCEHVIEAAAALAAALLSGCDRLRVLATSREPLRLPGESRWALLPLSLPGTDEQDLAVLAGADAVALFCERAAEARVGFHLNAGNAAAVTAICARLEGIPLALELAAARVRALPVAQIADRLQHSFDLLSKGPRGAGDRQSSLRATIAWSHGLLSESEQTLFRRLAIFAAGFSLDAVERVCADGLHPREVLDALDGLVDKSLVVLGEDQARPGRYRLLETIRADAAERLAEAGEEQLLASRHASYYGQLAHDCSLAGDSVSALDRLDDDHPNLLAALEQLASRGPPDAHGQLAADLSSYWELRSQWQLGRRQLARYLEQPDRDPSLAGRCAGGLGILNLRLGDYAGARHRLDEALVIARQLGERALEGRWLGYLGALAFHVGDLDEARACYQQALAVVVELGDRRQTGVWVGNLGMVAAQLGDYAEARTRYAEALALARQVGDRRFEGFWVGNLADVASQVADYQEAQARYEQALAISQGEGDRRHESFWVSGLGEVASHRGDPAEARARYQQALAIARKLGDRYHEQTWLANVGRVAFDTGDYPEAQSRYLEALTIAGQLGKQEAGLLEACAELLAGLGRCAEAAVLLGAADDLAERHQQVRAASARARYDATLSACRARLGPGALASASGRGRALTWERAVSAALEMLSSGQGSRTTAYPAEVTATQNRASPHDTADGAP
jgi:predicted ATPase/DNA-binding SARP family transcriptional activator/Tfp pilus assembly protein PilF